MTKWKKIIIVISAIAVLVVACFLSWSYGFREGIHVGGFTSSMAEFALSSQHMGDQLANANCDGAKQAIVDYLNTVEKYKNVKNGIITESSYQADKMLGHMRLALIEEKQGNQSEKMRHLAIAKDACIARKWEDCSEEKLSMYVRRFLEKNPVACLKNSEHVQPRP